MPRRVGAEGQPAAMSPAPPGFSSWVLLVVLVFLCLSILFVTGAQDDRGPAKAIPPWRAHEAVARGIEQRTGDNLTLEPVDLVLLGIIPIFLVRRARLGWLARKPGPINVADLVDGTPGKKLPVADLTQRFRAELSRARLYPPALVPGSSPPVEFLDLLSTAGEHGKVLAAIGTFLRLGWPSHAYIVIGTLQRRDIAPALGIAVQVVGLPRARGAVVMHWGRTWDEVIESSARAVAAEILPRTSASNGPPWQDWRRRVVPHQLFDVYQRAQDLQAEHRYDEAFFSYLEALRLDPRNLDIRLSIAKLQELQALHLGALVTYEDVMTLQPGSDRSRTSTISAAPWSLRRRNRRFTWETRRRDVFEPRYRHLLRLGFTEKLAEEWSEKSDDRESDRVRIAQRDRVRQRLLDCYGDQFRRALPELDVETLLLIEPGDLARSKGLPSHITNSKRLIEISDTHDGVLRRRVIEILFMLAARHEAEQLLVDFSSLRRRLSGTLLSASALRIAQEWSGIRFWLANARLYEALGSLTVSERQEVGRFLPEKVPPPSFDAVEAIVRAELRRRWLRRKPGFREHYNAACTYALLMTPVGDGPLQTIRDRAARCAIEQLEKAVADTPSGQLATRREWLLSDDPDLDALRPHERFRRFEARYFPSSRLTCPRPPDVQRYQAALYLRNVLKAVSLRMEQLWHRRAERAGDEDLDLHEAIGWWTDELTVWDVLKAVCSDPADNWQARYRLLRTVSELSDQANGGPWSCRTHRSNRSPSPSQTRVW